jgi:peptidoglycan hydrolase-like protein with peptidoglycan-binding domain
MLQGAALDEANRPIQDQVALQTRLQSLGFLSAQAQMDGVFGTGTRAAIKQWQTSVGRQPTGLLGVDDAQALSNDDTPSANSVPNSAAPAASLPTDYSTVPADIQGVWSNDCDAFYGGNTPTDNSVSYNVFGPNAYLTVTAQGVYENNNVTDVIETTYGFAMIEDLSDPDTASPPQIAINIYQRIGENQIREVADFNRDNSNSVRYFTGAGYVSEKCHADAGFNNSVTLSQLPHDQSETEGDSATTVLDNMPIIEGVQWNPNPPAAIIQNSPPLVSAKAVEDAWMPYMPEAACMAKSGSPIQALVHAGTLPTDPTASQVLNQCTTNANSVQPDQDGANNQASSSAVPNASSGMTDPNMLPINTTCTQALDVMDNSNGPDLMAASTEITNGWLDLDKKTVGDGYQPIQPQMVQSAIYVGAVKLYCQENPSDAFSMAIFNVYMNARKQLDGY